MSTSHSGYSFPGASGGGGYTAPSATSPSASSTPRVICPGEGTRFPPLDSRLVTPETREEMVGGVLIKTMAADPPHGDAHFDFAAVLGPILKPGYVGSIDMLTRYDQEEDFAADLTIRRGGKDPETGERYLEELAFEIGNSQRVPSLVGQAAKMTRRGVRRVFAVLVKEQMVYEWDSGRAVLVELEGAIEDPPTLCRPLPVQLLLLIARGAFGRAPVQQVREAVEDYTAESLAVKGNAVIQRIEQRGELRGVAQTLLRVLSKRGVAVDELSQRRVLACQDLAVLQRWMDNALTASHLGEVFG